MTVPLSKLLANTCVEGDAHTLDVTPDWLQGRTVFGGLQVALALRAMRALVPEAPLRTLQAVFIAPAGPSLRACATVLRSGKSVTHVEARIGDGDDTQAIVVGVFGQARSSRVSVLPTQPTLHATSPIALHYVPGVPAFLQHFDARWLVGGPPFSGRDEDHHVIELGLKDDALSSEAHVIAFADFIPPLALCKLKSPAPGSTLTWMLELVAESVDGLPLAGWRVDADLAFARDGYLSQSLVVYGPDGTPLALGRQSMVVFD